jgi:sugar phosphate isomerase/epimerase
MKIGLSSLLFVKASLEDAIRGVAEVGADYIEIICDLPHFMPDFDLAELKKMKELLDSYGLGVSIHSTFWDLNPASHYSEIRKLATMHIKKSIDACDILGGKIVVIHPGRCPVTEFAPLIEMGKSWYRKSIEECLRHANEMDITLTLENLNGGIRYPYSTAREIKALTRELGGLGLTLDIGHAYVGEKLAGTNAPEREIAAAIRDVGDCLMHLHIHDNKSTFDEHLPPGEGSIDFKPILQALKDVGYDGIWVAEVWGPRDPFETGRRGVNKTRELLTKF